MGDSLSYLDNLLVQHIADMTSEVTLTRAHSPLYHFSINFP